MGIVGLLISRGVRFMSDGLNGPTNEEARELLEIRLEEAQAQHAEDLAKLGRELAEVVAQRDAAREERDQYLQACENWRKLDAPLSEFRRVLRVGDHESTIDAARRMSRELEVCLGQLDHVTAREKSVQLEAYALGRKSAEDQEAEWESERKAYAVLGAKIGESLLGAARRVVAERDDARGSLDAVSARLADQGGRVPDVLPGNTVPGFGEGSFVDLSSIDTLAQRVKDARSDYREHDVKLSYVVDRITTIVDEAFGMQPVMTHEELLSFLEDKIKERGRDLAAARARIAELEAARASASLVTMVGDIGVRNSGDATRLEAILAERDALAAELAAIRAAARTRGHGGWFRARVAELEAAPQGLPVATDEELREAYITAITGAESPAAVLPHALRAVAARVRAERPACLVARAVALGCDVRVCEDVAGWLVAIHESSDLDEDVHRDVAASDVPATLARLLDEVEAARKAGAK